MKSVIAAHDKKLLSENINTVPPCNCKIKNKYPLNEKCRTRNILCKCTTSIIMKPDKVYLGTTEEILNKLFITIKNLSTTVLIVITQHSPNTLGTTRKNTISSFEIVHCKDSFIIFEYNQEVFAVPPQKIQDIILP